MDPHGGNYEQQARYFTGRAVLDGAVLTEAQEELARAVLEVVLLAGLPPYSIEAAAGGEETGVALVPEGRRALRVVWQQDPAAARYLLPELCDVHQAAMNQALRTILSAHRFQSPTAHWARRRLSLGSLVPMGEAESDPLEVDSQPAATAASGPTGAGPCGSRASTPSHASTAPSATACPSRNRRPHHRSGRRRHGWCRWPLPETGHPTATRRAPGPVRPRGAAR